MIEQAGSGPQQTTSGSHPNPFSSSTLENWVESKDDNLQEYWYVIRKRWLFILFITLFVAAAGVFYTISSPDIYEATSLISITPPQSRLIGEIKVEANHIIQKSYINTQITILKSLSVAEKVISYIIQQKLLTREQLALFCGDSVFPTFLGKEKNSPDLDTAGKILLKSITVQQRNNSDILEVICFGRDPIACTVITNLFVNVFMENDRERSKSSQTMVRNWLQTELPQLKEELKIHDEEIRKFQQDRSKLIYLSSEQSTLPTGNIERLKQELQEIKIHLLTAKIRYQKIQKVKGKSYYSILALDFFRESTIFEYLRQQELILENQLNEARLRYKPKHPKIVGLSQALADIKDRLKREAQAFLMRQQQIYRDLLEKGKLVQEMLKGEEEIYAQQKGDYLKYKESIRQRELLERRYWSFAEELDTLNSTIKLDDHNIQLIDEAKSPKFPSRPKRLQNSIFSIAFGLLLGIALAFLFEHFDQRVKSIEEIQGIVQSHALGFIPFAPPKVFGDSLAKAVVEHDRSHIAEAFRGIATSLFFGEDHPQKATFVVSSAIAGEGKTNTICNLALIVSRAGYRVLLVDGDLYKPQVHKRLQVSNDKGLRELLEKEATLAEVVQPISEKLSIISAGKPIDDPYDCIVNSSFDEILKEMREEYDYVLIDSSPMGMTSDPLLYARESDGMIFVVSMQKSNKKMLQQMFQRLRNLRIPIRGFILNDKQGDYIAEQTYYSYYGYSYKSYYQQEGKRKPKSK